MSIPNLESWMWAEACEILDRANRIQRQFFRPAVINVAQVTWEPPIDVYESNIDFKIHIALPGVVPEQLKVKLEDGLLCVYGYRPLLAESDSHIRRLEIPYGRFERQIELACETVEIDTFEFVNGCLLISLRKL